MMKSYRATFEHFGRVQSETLTARSIEQAREIYEDCDCRIIELVEITPAAYQPTAADMEIDDRDTSAEMRNNP